MIAGRSAVPRVHPVATGCVRGATRGDRLPCRRFSCLFGRPVWCKPRQRTTGTPLRAGRRGAWRFVWLSPAPRRSHTYDRQSRSARCPDAHPWSSGLASTRSYVSSRFRCQFTARQVLDRPPTVDHAEVETNVREGDLGAEVNIGSGLSAWCARMRVWNTSPHPAAVSHVSFVKSYPTGTRQASTTRPTTATSGSPRRSSLAWRCSRSAGSVIPTGPCRVPAERSSG